MTLPPASAWGIALRLLRRRALALPLVLMGWPLVLAGHLLALAVLGVGLSWWALKSAPPLLQTLAGRPLQGLQHFATLQFPFLAGAVLLVLGALLVVHQALLLQQAEQLLGGPRARRGGREFARLVVGLGFGRLLGLLLGLPALAWAVWAAAGLAASTGWGVVSRVAHLVCAVTLTTSLSMALAAQPAVVAVHRVGPWQSLRPALRFGLAARRALGRLAACGALARLVLELPLLLLVGGWVGVCGTGGASGAAWTGVILGLGALAAVEAVLRAVATVARLVLYRGCGGAWDDAALAARGVRAARGRLAAMAPVALRVASVPAGEAWRPAVVAGQVPREALAEWDLPGTTAAVVP